MKRISVQEAHKYRKLNSGDFRYGMYQAIAFTLSPSDGNFENVTYYGEAWIDPSSGVKNPHWIYVLVNPSMSGICKIGYTTTSVYQRVREINASTGVLTPYYPVFSYKCGNGKLLEQEIHNELERMGYRINNKREGFEISSDLAAKIIESIGEKYKNQL